MQSHAGGVGKYFAGFPLILATTVSGSQVPQRVLRTRAARFKVRSIMFGADLQWEISDFKHVCDQFSMLHGVVFTVEATSDL